MASLRALVVVLALLTGCDTGDGRELRPPPPGATAPPLPSSTTSTDAGAVIGPPVGSEEEVVNLALSSPAFVAGGDIPVEHTCDGDNVSPPLTWTGVPAGTVELAVTVIDNDVPDGEFVHWVVTGLDPALSGIGAGAVPEGAVEARNDTSEFGWFGPCPPDNETHAYSFTLYALQAPSGVTRGAGAPEALAAIRPVPSVAANLTALYG